MIWRRANVRARACASSRWPSAGESRSNSGHRFRNQIVSLMEAPGRPPSVGGARRVARATVPAYPAVGRLTTPFTGNAPLAGSPPYTAGPPLLLEVRVDHPPLGRRPDRRGGPHFPGPPGRVGRDEPAAVEPAGRAVAVHAPPRRRRARPHAPVPGRAGAEQLGRGRPLGGRGPRVVGARPPPPRGPPPP